MSRALKVALEAAKYLHSIGEFDTITMKELEALCLPQQKTFKPEEIRHVREQIKVSQRVFAALLNVSPSTVQQWESGTKRPSGMANKLLSIAESKGIEALV